MNRQTVVGKGSAEIKVYKGKSVFEGIAIGKIRLIKIKKRKFQGTLIVDPDSETLLKYVKKEEEERSKQELLLTLRRAVRRFSCMPTSEVCLICSMYCRMTQPESDCSAVSFFIWKSRIIRPKRSSFRYINP